MQLCRHALLAPDHRDLAIAKRRSSRMLAGHQKVDSFVGALIVEMATKRSVRNKSHDLKS